MKVVEKKDLDRLKTQLKGIEGVAKTLETDINNGIPDNEKKIARRRKMLGSNTYKKPAPQGLLISIWDSLRAFVVFKEFVSVFVSFFLFVAASAIGRHRPSRKKSKASNNTVNQIEVLRGGKIKKIPISEIVVGDVVCLNIEDKVPADGLFLKGNNLHVDESSMVEDGTDDRESHNVKIDETNPFLFSGSRVVDGYGCQMVVTSVGMKAKWCKILNQHSSKTSDRETTVEERLNRFTYSIRIKIGLPIAIIGFVIMLGRYICGKATNIYGRREDFMSGLADENYKFLDSSLVQFVTTAFTTIVVAIPESLRFGVQLTIFFSKKRTMGEMQMVIDLSGSETMGSITAICTNKTGTLTMNHTKVTKFWLGQCSLEKEASFSNVSNLVQNLLQEGIGLNTSSGRNGTPTDKAILSWAIHDLHTDMKVKSRCAILRHCVCHDQEAATFSSQSQSHKKLRSGILMKRMADNTEHIHWKGEAEVILEMCSSYYDKSGTIKDLDDRQKEEFHRIIQGMTESSLQCIAFAGVGVDSDGNHHQMLKENGLVLLALVGVTVEEPCRPEMKEAVKDCHNAKVDVKMFTGDDVSTAKHIARECGILTDPCQEGEVIKGEEFRSYTLKERVQKVDKIRVMASSSPDDKLLMVKTLKEKGDIVAVCGNSKNDVLPMVEADVGIYMGTEGTDVGKKISNFVILDDNFAAVANVLKSSICIYNNIQKFIQFQLTLNLALLDIIFISASFKGEIPFNSAHVLWVNLILSTLAALALATEKPTKEPIKRQPLGRKEPLISNVMWRNLLGQVVYQIVVVFTLMFKAKSILGVDDSEGEIFFLKRNALIFNAFMLCQVFNLFNARNLESIKKVFKGIHRDITFLLIIVITISLQLAFVEFFLPSDDDYAIKRLKKQWGICFGIAVISWPIDWVVKCIPVPDKPLLSYLGIGYTRWLNV
ncbi:calcium-transporting ATPase 12, plasma membrane-type-like [Ziziphus jujuba]|uniref:Calcium-transporting ATPase n=1 Tax=Ziziphus jujuba TaxID=326968 RepID=A0ABM4A3W3_ZIZJJ|nr:calcium-transporting ATPase 12, plasma membrane-type-like [Ziziphus jujuba]